MQSFSLDLDFCGAFCGLEFGQAAGQALAEAGDGLDFEFQLPGQCFGPGDAGMEQAEELSEAALLAEVLIELSGDALGLGGGFLVEEGFERVRFRGRDEFDDPDGFAVVGEGGIEVGLIEGEEVFFAVVEAVDVAPDKAAEFTGEEVRQAGGVSVRRGGLSAEQLEDGFGGDGVGVVTVGQDAAEGAAPAEGADLLLSVEQGLPEDFVPGLVRRGRLDRVSALHG